MGRDLGRRAKPLDTTKAKLIEQMLKAEDAEDLLIVMLEGYIERSLTSELTICQLLEVTTTSKGHLAKFDKADKDLMIIFRKAINVVAYPCSQSHQRLCARSITLPKKDQLLHAPS